MRVGERFMAAFAGGDRARLEGFYTEDAILWTPLTGPLNGREAIGAYFRELRDAFPGLRIALHDEFASPDGGRASIRVQMDWRNTGSFRGHPPTGRSGEMAELHSFRFAGKRVNEHFAGVSGFQLPGLFLADWGLEFPREAGDPAPEICAAAPGDPPATTANASLARRFVDAFGRRDAAALNEIYAEDVALYTPLAWPVRGHEALMSFVLEFHTANPGLRVALHDEFYSADSTRACWRIRLHYRNTGPFYGNPPTGETGVMTETHAVRLTGGRITEHIVGDNTYHMPRQELVAWHMPHPEHTPDPAQVISSVTVPVPTAGQ